MSSSYCERFGYDEDKIGSRLSFLGLTVTDHRQVKILQESVIIPNSEAIIEHFYQHLQTNTEFNEVITSGYKLDKLKATQLSYLLTLGVNFDQLDYIEQRLRVGMAHVDANIALSLYLGAYRLLQQLIINHIPDDIRRNAADFDQLLALIIKIISLDITLAVDTYHRTKVSNLEKSLDTILNDDELLRRKVDTDSLTGLTDHAHAIDILSGALLEFKKTKKPLCLIMADLDYFKQVNDNYGHLVGDIVLQDVAARMQSAVRDFDTVGRYGGEEFIILFENTSKKRAKEIAERIRKLVGENNPIKAKGNIINITISQGLSAARVTDTVESLIDRADMALYAAKDAGRNCVKIL